MKKIYLFCFYFIIFIAFIQCSLASNDSIVLKLNKESENLRTIDSKKAIEMSIRAVKLADEGNNISFKGLSYKNLGVALYYHSAFQEALNCYQKALDFFIEIHDSIGISACYNNMALVYKDINSLDIAMNFYQNALAIDKKLNNEKSLAITFNNMGEIYHMQGKYILAIQYYKHSLKYEKKLKNLDGMADCYLNIGAVMEENSLFDKALYYYEKALKLYLFTLNKYRLGQCYNNMGIVFTRLNDFYKAKDFLNTSLEIKESINDIQGEVTSLLNLGNLYILMNDSSRAKDCFIKAIYYDNSQAFINLQELEKEDPLNFQNVDDYFFYWISYNIEQGYYMQIPQNLFFKGFLHYKLGEYSKAINYFTNSLEISEFQQIPYLKKDNYLYLSKSFEQIEDFKNASFYAQQYICLTDSINASILSDFNTLNSNATVEYNPNNITLQDIEKQKKYYKDIWFYCTIFLSILLVILIIRFTRKK